MGVDIRILLAHELVQTITKRIVFSKCGDDLSKTAIARTHNIDINEVLKNAQHVFRGPEVGACFMVPGLGKTMIVI